LHQHKSVDRKKQS